VLPRAEVFPAKRPKQHRAAEHVPACQTPSFTNPRLPTRTAPRAAADLVAAARRAWKRVWYL